MRKRVAGLSETSLERFLLRARKAVRTRGKVNLLITSSRQLQSLNQRFRGKNKPTDVLSFPVPPEHSSGLAGDVAISADIAKANARRLGHSTAEEIKILALHGVLHLAGYDHERDHGEMARKEQTLRKSLGLPISLIERIQQETSNHSQKLGRKGSSSRTPR